MRGNTDWLICYPYCDRDREVVSTKYRFEPGKNGRSKSFSWDNGNPGVLYNLPEIIEADHVHICEGEKAADRLNEILPVRLGLSSHNWNSSTD